MRYFLNLTSSFGLLHWLYGATLCKFYPLETFLMGLWHPHTAKACEFPASLIAPSSCNLKVLFHPPPSLSGRLSGLNSSISCGPMLMISSQCLGISHSFHTWRSGFSAQMIVRFGYGASHCINGTFSITRDEDALKDVSTLDWYYVIRSKQPADQGSVGVIHRRYKHLARVEWAIRTMKSDTIDLIPVSARKKIRTRGHTWTFVNKLHYRAYMYSEV